MTAETAAFMCMRSVATLCQSRPCARCVPGWMSSCQTWLHARRFACARGATMNERLYQRDWREVLLDAMNSPRLSVKDQEFIGSLLARSGKYQLSQPQLAWLEDIEHKVYAAG